MSGSNEIYVVRPFFFKSHHNLGKLGVGYGKMPILYTVIRT